MKKTFALVVALATFFSTSNIYSTTNDLAGIASGGCEGQNPLDPTSVMPPSNETAAQLNQEQINTQNNLLQLQQNQNTATQQNLSAPDTNNVLASSQAQEMTPYDYRVHASLSLDPGGAHSNDVTITMNGDEAILEGPILALAGYQSNQLKGKIVNINETLQRAIFSFDIYAEQSTVEIQVTLDKSASNVAPKIVDIASLKNFWDFSFGSHRRIGGDTTVYYFNVMTSDLVKYERKSYQIQYADGELYSTLNDEIELRVHNDGDFKDNPKIELSYTHSLIYYENYPRPENFQKVQTSTQSKTYFIPPDSVSGFAKIASIGDQYKIIERFKKTEVYTERNFKEKASNSVERVKNDNGIFEDRLSIKKDANGLSRYYIVMGQVDWKKNNPASDPADIEIIQNQTVLLPGSSGGGCNPPLQTYQVFFGAESDKVWTGNYGLNFKKNNSQAIVVDYPTEETVTLDNTTYYINIENGKVDLKPRPAIDINPIIPTQPNQSAGITAMTTSISESEALGISVYTDSTGQLFATFQKGASTRTARATLDQSKLTVSATFTINAGSFGPSYKPVDIKESELIIQLEQKNGNYYMKSADFIDYLTGSYNNYSGRHQLLPDLNIVTALDFNYFMETKEIYHYEFYRGKIKSEERSIVNSFDVQVVENLVQEITSKVNQLVDSIMPYVGGYVFPQNYNPFSDGEDGCMAHEDNTKEREELRQKSFKKLWAEFAKKISDRNLQVVYGSPYDSSEQISSSIEILSYPVYEKPVIPVYPIYGCDIYENDPGNFSDPALQKKYRLKFESKNTISMKNYEYMYTGTSKLINKVTTDFKVERVFDTSQPTAVFDRIQFFGYDKDGKLSHTYTATTVLNPEMEGYIGEILDTVELRLFEEGKITIRKASKAASDINHGYYNHLLNGDKSHDLKIIDQDTSLEKTMYFFNNSSEKKYTIYSNRGIFSPNDIRTYPEFAINHLTGKSYLVQNNVDFLSNESDDQFVAAHQIIEDRFSLSRTLDLTGKQWSVIFGENPVHSAYHLLFYPSGDVFFREYPVTPYPATRQYRPRIKLSNRWHKITTDEFGRLKLVDSPGSTDNNIYGIGVSID